MTIDANCTHKLRDGTTIRIERMKPEDAAEAIDYLKAIADETIFFTGDSTEAKRDVKKIADQYREQSDTTTIFLKGAIDGKIVATGHIERPQKSRLKHNGELGISVLK